MNILKLIYPLRVRNSIFGRLANRIPPLPNLADKTGFNLTFGGQIRSLWPSDCGHRCIAWTGFYEIELSRQIASLARQGGLMIDVGANAGYFSCIWGVAKSNNRVLAFEASPRNRQMLKTNIEANQLSSRVEIHEFALGKAEGKLAFDLGPIEQTGWGGLAKNSSSNSVLVEVRCLDRIIGDKGTIAVLKIDTEGADAWVIEGAMKLLQQKRIQHVFYEENLVRMAALDIPPGTAREILTACGYRVSTLVHGSGSTEFHAVPA